MGKRKGKIGTPASSGPIGNPTTRQSTLEAYGIRAPVTPMPTSTAQTSAHSSCEGVTLSPPSQGLTPPQPGSSVALSSDRLRTSEVGLIPTALGGGLLTESFSGETSIEGLRSTSTPLQPREGIFGGICGVVKPASVTIDMLWNVIQRLDSTLIKISESLQGETQELRNNFQQLSTKVEENTDSLKKLETEIVSSKETTVILIKERNVLARKHEFLENQLRKNNLRLLNFPVTTFISPIEMLKKYLSQILGFTNDNLPPVTKAYYVKGKSVNEQLPNAGAESLNVTELLESSVITDRATLIVSFAFELDKINVQRIYFQRMKEDFMGGQIKIFPDLSWDTQLRRKKLLAFRARVLALGGSFFIKFPCKCLISYESTNFLFIDPMKLQEFVIAKESLRNPSGTVNQNNSAV